MKKWSDAGTEKLEPTVIILFTFILVSAFLLAMVPANIMSGTTPGVTINPNTLIDGTSYDYLTPITGRAITWANHTHEFEWEPRAGSIAFHTGSSGEQPVYIQTVRNNTYPWFTPAEWSQFDNYIGVEQKVGGTYNRFAVSYPQLTNLANTTGGTSVNYTFTFGTSQVVLRVVATGNFTDKMFNQNTFTVYLFIPTLNAGFLNPSSTGWWESLTNFFNVLGSLLFGYSMPGNWILSYIVSIAIWAATIFVAFMLISRAIHGGG